MERQDSAIGNFFNKIFGSRTLETTFEKGQRGSTTNVTRTPGLIGQFFSRIFQPKQKGTSDPTQTGQPRQVLSPSPAPSPTITPRPQPQPQVDPFAGFAPASGATPSATIAPIIERAASDQGASNLIMNLLTAILSQESQFNPLARNVDPNDPTSIDRGIAQFNTLAFPEITDAQADDPEFAIPEALRKLMSDIEFFGGDVNRGLAAFNVGRGGAQNVGDTPSGTGPLGQRYIDNVSRNLAEEAKRELGLSVLTP